LDYLSALSVYLRFEGESRDLLFRLGSVLHDLLQFWLKISFVKASPLRNFFLVSLKLIDILLYDVLFESVSFCLSNLERAQLVVIKLLEASHLFFFTFRSTD